MIENQLRKLDVYKGQGAKIRARLHWYKDGNRSSKYFFNFLNYKHKKEYIGAIQDDSGQIRTKPDDIKTIFHNFYEKLFVEDSHWEDVQLIWEDTIKPYIPQKVNIENSRFLDRLLSIEELERVVFSMSPHKSPGIDGLSVEFYQAMWPHIKEDFHRVYLEAFQQGSLGPNINKGLVKLLPKGKNEDIVAGWRPITLLNTSYKIIAKALATRIRPIVKKIVRPEQT